MKNILNIEITRPSQVLIIMRGISGSGKSTKAKRLVSMVGKGVIHSTDDIITKTGDYRGFFNKMIESNDFGVLGKMHGQNLNNAIDSMKNDVSPVIIDNTCLTIKQIKPYVLAALDMGLASC